MHLRPVEAGELRSAPGEQEAARIEPALLLARLDVGARPRPLLGMVRERRGIHPQPGVLVRPDDEVADLDPVGHGRPVDRRIEAAPKLEQLALPR